MNYHFTTQTFQQEIIARAQSPLGASPGDPKGSPEKGPLKTTQQSNPHALNKWGQNKAGCCIFTCAPISSCTHFNKDNKKSTLSGFTHSTSSSSASALMIFAEWVKSGLNHGCIWSCVLFPQMWAGSMLWILRFHSSVEYAAIITLSCHKNDSFNYIFTMRNFH